MGIRAAVIPAPGSPVEVHEIAPPDLELDSALLAVEASEVCGTDVHLRAGRLDGVPYPLVPGHVTAGTLQRIRGALYDIDGRQLAEGDRVTFFDVHRTCNACWYCRVARASTRCPQRRVYGITYGLDDGPSGGWATHVYLKPGTQCIPLGDVGTHDFLRGGCALPTALHALERGPARFADSVVVLGSGPVGLALVALCRLRGTGTILCIGAPERRLQVARQLGATATLDFRDVAEPDRLAWVREHTGGRGADVVFEASGDPRAVVQAMRATRDAGCAIIAGQYTDGGDATFNPHHDLNRKHLDVHGSWGSDYSHFHRAVQLLADPGAAAAFAAVELRPYGLDHLDQALDDVAAGNVVKALVDPHLAP